MKALDRLRGWLDVGPVEHVPLRGARRVEIDGLVIGVFRVQSGEVYALENKCPHKDGPLTEGIVHDTGVTCPLHNWVIDLQSGQARGADSGCVRTFPVEVRDGRICIKLRA